MRKYCFILIILLCSQSITAQVDSAKLKLNSLLTGATQPYQPHYSVHNQFGMVADERVSGFLGIGTEMYKKWHKFNFTGGIDIVYQPIQSVVIPHQAYLSAEYKWLKFTGGRFEQVIGEVPDELTTGSMGISRNSRPIPMVQLSVDEYQLVPFTKGHLKFKGSYLHGWMGKNRYVKNSFLHAKSFYLKTGDKLPFEMYFGGAHYAIGGGHHPTKGKILSGFRNYKNVVLGRQADPDSYLGGEIMNVAGSHLAIMDYGIKANIKKKYRLWIYSQIPIEGHGGNNPLNRDRLVGVNFSKKEAKGVVSGIAYEFINTKWQNGPGLPDPVDGVSNHGYSYHGRHDYYNNYLYRSGWTYHSNVIGNPLLTTVNRAELYFDSIKAYNVSIANNRILGHHLGLHGIISKLISYEFMVTYTRNYGTYAGTNGGRFAWGSLDPEFNNEDYPFIKPLNQVYSQIKLISKHKNENWNLNGGLSIDYGEMSKNIGVFGGISHNFTIKKIK